MVGGVGGAHLTPLKKVQPCSLVDVDRTERGNFVPRLKPPLGGASSIKTPHPTTKLPDTPPKMAISWKSVVCVWFVYYYFYFGYFEGICFVILKY